MSTTESPTAGASADIVDGVSLEQYAGVSAALAEGLPLEAILSSERIAPDAWKRAEVAWKVRVARDGTEGPLFAELCTKRVVAEDTLARAVAPIDTDLGAWMSFLHAYGAHPAPFELIEGAGLGVNDLSRLQRGWARRMTEDEELQKRAAELAKKGPGPLPAIRVQPAVLKPFPWSLGSSVPAAAPAPARPKVAMPADTSLAPGQVRLFSYVAVKAQLAESPGDERRVLEKLGLTDFATTDAGWQEILSGDPDLERDYRRLLEVQRAKLRGAKEGKPGPKAPVAALAAQAASAAPTRQPSVAPARPPAKLAGTALAVDIPRAAALPFQDGSGASSTRAPLSSPPAPSTPLELPKAAPKGSLAGTSLAVDIPQRAALPFPAPARTSEPPPGPSPEAGKHRAPPPGVTTPPPLTLEQHASLSCEIAEAPERAMDALARYELTPDAKRAADQHYAARFAQEPGVREAWDRAYQTYRTWWLANRISR